jgi:TraC-like protein
MDKKGRRRTTLSDIDEQIEQLKAKRRHMVQQRAERFAKIAAQAGLADVDISDDEALAFKSCTLRNRCRAGPRADEPPARLTPSMRDPVHVATLEWSLCLAPPMSFIRLMMQRTGFQPKGSSRPEVGLEAHVNQGPHLRGSKIHQGGIAPAPLPGFRFGAGPERLHLFLDLKQDLAPEGFAELELSGQGHGALPVCYRSRLDWPKCCAVPSRTASALTNGGRPRATRPCDRDRVQKGHRP